MSLIEPEAADAQHQANYASSSPSRILEQSPVLPQTSSLIIPAPALASGRYNRQLLLPQLRLRGQEYLLSSRVLIIGLGGLGSPAALYLAGAGIGTLGLMDSDNVEISNLHRQVVHTESAARSSMTKVRSAAARCKELNSEIEYKCHEEQGTGRNILDIVSQYDLVLDCTDNPATRYLISDACVTLGKVLVSGAAQKGEGMLVVLNSPPFPLSEAEEKGPCYRCVFPRPPAPETVRGCSEIGVLGPVVGTIGTLMAGEAIKIISSGGHLPRAADEQRYGITKPSTDAHQKEKKQQHTMLLYNTYAADPRSMFRTITLRGRRKDCVACGDDETLVNKGLSRITTEVISQGRLDYQAFCGVFEDVKLLGEENRINAREFLEIHAQHRRRGGKRKRRPIVVDVREEHEYELGPKVRDSVNIPISRILRHGGGAFDELGFGPQAALGGGIGPDAGMIDQESHIPVEKQTGFYSSQDRQPATESSGVSPDGGLVNQESHIPIIEQTGFPNSPDWDFAAQSDAIGPDGGMIDQESHIPVIRQNTFRGAGLEPDGRVIGQESYIPVARQTASPTAPLGPDGGMIDQESHIPVDTARGEFSGARSWEFPGNPDTERKEEDGSDAESEPPPVYFVCQHGNDSQIAAQKLIERVKAEEATAEHSMKRKRTWGWIGDVKGGFVAMERHASL